MKKLKKIKNACAVLALCFASGIDEDTVLRVCTLNGFDTDEGMADEDWLDSAEDLGLELKKTPVTYMRLKKFINEYHEGLYIVCTWNHLFCVDSGIIIDPRTKTAGEGRIVRGAWRVL